MKHDEFQKNMIFFQVSNVHEKHPPQAIWSTKKHNYLYIKVLIETCSIRMPQLNLEQFLSRLRIEMTKYISG